MQEYRTGNVYAMKVLEGGKKLRENSLREVEILSRVDHPNVIKMHDHQVSEHSVHIVLEYCPRTLYDYLQCAIYPMNKQNVKTIAFMLLSGLAELHSSGVIHRDLKPQNILINEHNVIKIADFGQAIREEERDEEGNFPDEGFTYWYKPPELLQGSRKYDWQFDIW